MKVFAKKSLASFLAFIMVLSVCPLWLISIPVGADSTAQPTTNERSWSLPVPTFYEEGDILVQYGAAVVGQFKSITVGGVTYPRGNYVDSAAIIDTSVGDSDLEWIYYAYGPAGSVEGSWTYGMIIRPKEGAVNTTIPAKWNGYTQYLAGTLKEVYIADGVTGIGNEVFKNQVNLKHVYLAPSVKTIGNNAFSGCGELVTINLNYVESIGNNAFYDGNNICSKFIGSLVDTDGNLYGGTGIATAPGAVLRYIGTNAFRGCNALKRIYTGSGESNENRAIINGYAFYNLYALVYVQFGSNLNMNDAHHFSYTYRLKTLKFGDNVKIGNLSFYDCYGLNYLDVGTNIDIVDRAFDLCTAMTSSEGKSYLDLTGVNTIGVAAFRSNLKTTEVRFSARLTSMGQLAFSDNEKLETVNLVDTSLTEISRAAFARTAISSVVIPKDVLTVGDFAFSAYIPEGNARVSGWYVSGGSVNGTPVRKLTSLSFETGSVCTTIGAYAFYRQNLSTVDFPTTVNKINDYAFYSAGTISQVVLTAPTTMTVGGYAFCSIGLTSLKVNATDTFTCGTHAFSYNLVSTLEIAATGTVSLGYASFFNNRYLEKLEINAATTTIGSYAFSCDDGYANKVIAADESYTLTYPAYQTLKEVSISSSKVTFGERAFRNQMSLATLNLLGITEKSKLSVGHYAFGHDAFDAFSTVKDPLILTGTDGHDMQIRIKHGININLGNTDPSNNGPMSLFQTAINYYRGNSYTTELVGQTYSTCTEPGRYEYKLTIQEGNESVNAGSVIYFVVERPVLGHLYSEEVFNYANCVYGEYAEKHCIRGCVSHEFGVDADGLALANSSGLNVSDPCVESGAIVITETENAECLNHEYYAGTLYYKENVELTAAEYDDLGADLKTNFFIWYKENEGSGKINAFAYSKLSEEAKAAYSPIYSGTMYLTKSEYNKLSESEKAEYTAKIVGRVIYGNPEVNSGAITVQNIGGGNGSETFTSPFNNYIPVYIEYACYRDTHEVLTETESYPYRVAYLPTNLTGKTDQQLVDIYLELKNLGWADPSTSLEGGNGIRCYAGIYKNDGNGIDVFKNVELDIYINVSRVELSIQNVTMTNFKQSTDIARKHVGISNLPAGVSTYGTTPDQYYDASNVLMEWDEVAGSHTAITGTVTYTVTYKNTVYDLIADTAGSSSVYWVDGVYNSSGVSNAADFKKVAYGYSIKSIEIIGDDAVVTLRHQFLLQTPSLSIVDAKADNVIYDGNYYGFTLTDIPASSAIEVIRWTTADSSGNAYTGEGAYSDSQQLTAPSNGLSLTTDLREIDTYKGIVSNAGTYYYQVKVTNAGYTGNDGGTSYIFYVTVNIAKAALSIPVGSSYEYDGSEKTGFAADSKYDITGDNTATTAGTYNVTLKLKNANYYWAGYAEDTLNATASWKIQKMTVKVPTVDETKRLLPYDGTYQTPLNLAPVNTVDSTGIPKTGDYRTRVTSSALTTINVEYYYDNAWHILYQLNQGQGLNKAQYTITASNLEGFGGLFDTENVSWPNNQSSFTLGSWNISEAVLENPTITLPNKEYDGQAYNETPVLSGTWTWVNSNGNVFNQDQSQIVFTYYNGNTQLTEMPTDVGLYTVKANIIANLQDHNYVLSSITSSGVVAYAVGSFQITKQQITLKSAVSEVNSSAEKPYTGKPQQLPEISFYNSNDELVEIAEENVTLRYYKTISSEEDVTTIDPVSGQEVTVKQTVYLLDPNDGGTLTAPAFSEIGTYVYMVAIDSQTPNYESVNYATTCLVIMKSEQGISVEKDDQNALPTIIKSGADYIIEANLGDVPLALHVTGEFDKKSVMTITYGANINGTNAPVAAKTEVLTEGSLLTLAFAQMTEGVVISVHTDGTDNAGAADCTITVKISKARPNITVSSALVGTSSDYTGNPVYTFSTEVSGTNCVSLTNKLTPVAITTEGELHNCTLLYYTSFEAAFDHDNTYSLDQPVEAGQYWVVARYDGDQNYLVWYSAPLNFTVGAAALTINGVNNIHKNYDGEYANLLDGITVSGNGANLTKAADSSAAVGSYWIEYYPVSSEIQPEATLEGWSTTRPNIANVGSSGTYWYRVSSKNYNTETRSISVTIDKVNVLLTANNSIVLTRQYDGTNKLYSTEGLEYWIAEFQAASSACVGPVNNEIAQVKASATLNGGKNTQTDGGVTIVYTVFGQDKFDKSNYLFNGHELNDELKLTDSTTYTATVTARELTVDGIASVLREYDGTKIVMLDSSSITVSGFVGSESITYSLRDDMRGVSSSAKSGLTDIVKYTNTYGQTITDYTTMFSAVAGSGSIVGNYKIGTVNFPQMYIDPRAIEIDSSAIPTTYEYTGTDITGFEKAVVKLAGSTYNTDDASVAADIAVMSGANLTYYFKNSNGDNLIGAPRDVGTYRLKVSKDGGPNYGGTSTEWFDITITSSSNLSVTFDSSKTSWTYDGTNHLLENTIDPETGIKGEPFVQLSRYSCTYIKFYSDAERTQEVTAVKNVLSSGTYYYTVGAPNYYDAQGQVTITVSKKNVTITKPTIETTKVYNGNTVAVVNGTPVISGAVNGEQITATAAALYNTADVATANTITVTYTMHFAGGADPSNYTYTAGTTNNANFSVNLTNITATETISGSISKLALTLSGITAITRTYDGSNKVDLVTATATLNGVITADSSAVEIAYIPSTGIITDVNYSASAKSVIVAWSSAILKGTKSGNYEVTDGNAVTVNINKATPTIDWVGTLTAGYSKAPVDLSYYNVKIMGKHATPELLADKTTNSAAIIYTFYSDAACTNAAVGSDPSVAPTNEGNYYVKAKYVGSANYNSCEEVKPLIITKTGIFGKNIILTKNDRTYNGKAESVITGLTLFSDLIEGGTNINITTSNNAKIYLAPVVSGQSRPANSSSVWQLAFGYENGEVISSGLLTVKDAGTYTYWVKFTADSHADCDYYGEEHYTQVSITISKATITVDSNVQKSKVYDGKVAAAVLSSAITGIQNSENITLAVNAVYTDKDVAKVKTIKVTYTLTFAGGAKADNYDVQVVGFSTSEKNGNSYTVQLNNGSITKRDIVIKGISATNRVYDNTTTVALTGTPVLSGALCVNDSSAIDDVSFSLISNQTGTITSAKPATYKASVNTNVISMTGTDSGNYNIVSVESPSVTISKKQIEITFGGKTSSGGIADTGALSNKTFTNKAMVIPANEIAVKTGDVTTGTNPASSAVIVYTYWTNSSCTVPAAGNSSVAPTSSGIYYVKASVAGDDYYLGASVVAKVVIDKATLSVTPSAYSSNYDGLAHKPATFVVKGADNNAITNYTVKFYSDSDRKTEITTVKNYSDSKTYYYTISFDDYNDYKDTVTVSIARINVVLSSSIVSSKVYDATSSAVVSNPVISSELGAIYTTLVRNEFDISATAAFNNKNAGTGKSITVTYTLTAKSSALLENYLFNGSTMTATENVVVSTNGVITKAPLTISGATAANKVYDSTKKAVISSFGTLVGVKSGDDVTLVTSTAVAVFSSANAANGIAVSYSGYTLTGADAANYELSQPANTTANISKKNISSSAVVLGPALTYTGSEQTQTISSVTIDGLTVTYTVSGNKETNAGKYTLTITGNGNFEGSVDVEWNIAKANYNMSGISFIDKSYTYDGTAHGIVIGGTLPTGADGIQITVNYSGTQTNVGSSAVVATFATSSANYNVPASMTAVVTVNKRNITVTPDDKTKVYGDADPAKTYTVTSGSLVSGESLTNISISRTSGENKGTYTYSIDSALANSSNTNYNITVATGKLTITARDIVITIGDQTHEYNKEEPWTNRKQNSSAVQYWTVTSGAIQNNARVQDNKDSLNVVLTKAAGINVGSSAITGTWNNANYNVTFVNGTYTITPRVITVVIGNSGNTYGEIPLLNATTVSLTAKKGGVADSVAQSEIATIRSALLNFKINASKESVVGDYSISASSGIYGNYNVTIVNGTYTVSKRTITVRADSFTKYYDADPETLTYTITEGMLVNGDQINVILTSAIAKTTNVGSTAIIVSSVTMSNGIDKTGNYEITTVNSSYTVNKANFSLIFSKGADTQPAQFDVDFNNPIVLTNTISGRRMISSNGNAFDGDIVWSVSSTAIAEVDSNGIVTPKTKGVVTVYVTLSNSNNYNITKSTYEYVLAISAAGPISASVTPYTGTQILTAAKKEGEYDLIDLVSVNVLKPAGAYTLVTEYSIDNGSTWSTEVPSSSVIGTTDIKVRITDPADQFDTFEVDVTAQITARPKHKVSFIGNGGTISGSTVVTVTDGVLITSSAFPTASYTGHIFKGWKDMTSGITKAAANWADTVEVTTDMFYEAQWDKEAVTVELVDDDFTFTGEPIFPEITVKIGSTAIDNTQYVAYYSSNLKAGTGKITVVCSGDYAGFTGEVDFTIKKAQQKKLIENGFGTSGAILLGDTTAVMAMGLIDNPVVTYTSSNNSVLMISSSGIVTTVAAGTAKITITVADTANVTGYVYEINVTVKEDDGTNGFNPQVSNDEGLEPGMHIVVKESGLDKNAQDKKVRNAASIYASDAALIYGSMTANELKLIVNGGNFVYDLDVTLYDKDNNVVTDYRGVYTVKVLLPVELREGMNFQVTHLDADGGVEVLESARYGKYLVFKTTHFSSFQCYFFNDIADADVSVEIDSSAVYTGSNVELLPTVRDIIGSSSVVLSSGVHYKVVYSNNFNVGTATVTIIGMGNYGGYRQVTFQITQAQNEWNEGATPDMIQDWTYGDAADEPAISAKYGDVIITYSVKGQTTSSAIVPTTPGDYTIHAVVIGNGNYTGLTLDEDFSIQAKTLGSSAIEAISDRVYTGSAIEPKLIIRDGDKTLTEGVDYTVAYVNNVNAGTATATVSFIGNYTGSADVDFTIKPAKNEFKAQLDTTVFTYDMLPKIPTVTVKDGTKVLSSAIDYDVVYRDAAGAVVTNPTKAGLYTVEIVGKGNYSGYLAEDSFVINKYSTSAVFVSPTVNKNFGDANFNNALTIILSSSHGIVSYFSSDASVASVNATTGEVSINKAGTVTITAYVAETANTKSAFATFALVVSPKDASGFDIVLSGAMEYTSEAIVPETEIKDGDYTLVEGVDYIVTVTNNVNAGEATVNVEYIGNYKGTASKKFTITPKTLTSTAIRNITDVVYTGMPVKPNYTVRACGMALSEGTDYSVSITNGINVGKATIEFTFKGNYTGTAVVYYNIIAKKGISVETVHDYFVYDGTAKNPSVVVKDVERNVVLVLGTDYSVSYRIAGTTTAATPIVAGTYEVVVSGKGNYAGLFASAEFVIVKCQNSIELASYEDTLTYESEGHAAFTVYSSAFAGTASFVSSNPSVVSVDSASGQLTIHNVGSAVIYITIAGDANHENVTASYKVNVAPKSISGLKATGIVSKTYTAGPITLNAGLKDGSIVLVEGVDFTVAYTNNINTGSATVTYTGHGKYTGTLVKNFSIIEKCLDSSAINAIASVVYTGDEQTPALIVKDGDLTLVEGKDYTVNYSDNVNVGTGKATVYFIGNYSGIAEAEFKITEAENKFSISLDSYKFTYDMLPKIPTAEVKDGAKVLVKDTDYTIVYRNTKGEIVAAPTDAGLYTVEIVGMGNYSGVLAKDCFVIGAYTTTAAFTDAAVTKKYGDADFTNALIINLADKHGAVSYVSSDTAIATVDADGKVTVLAAGTVTITAYVAATDDTSTAYATFTLTVQPKNAEDFDIVLSGGMEYNGAPIIPGTEIKDGDYTLVEGVDYIVNITENINVGTATVTVTYMGNYAGTGSTSFDITPKTLDSSAISPIDIQHYTGDELTPALVIRDGDKTLTEGVDYVVTYENNVNVGIATAKVTFIGNYSGEAEAQFEITTKDSGITSELEVNEKSYTGNDLDVNTTVKDGDKTLEKDTDYIVVYRDSEGKIVTAPKEVGAYTVEFIGKGNYSGILASRTFIVTPYETKAEFTDSSAIKTYGDEDFTNILIIDRNDEHGPVTYISSDTNVATVDENGKVKIVGIGSAVITAEVAASDNTSAAVASFVITVAPKSGDTMTYEISGNLIYTGKPIIPGLKLKDGDKTLVEGVDYTVTYVNNINAGTATAKITYIGNYSGNTDINYNIPTCATRVTVTLGNLSFVYNGKSQVPTITVKDGATKLTLNRDYTISYTDVTGKAVSAPVNAGAYIVKVTGKGNYNGTVVSVAYQITPAEVKASFASSKVEKTIDADDFTNALTLSPLTDGKVIYTSSDPSVAYVDANGKVHVVAHGNVTITAYIAATNNYQSATASYTLTVAGKNIGERTVDAIGTQIYTGKEITPKVIVRDGSKILVEGIDYTVSYTNNNAIGTGKAVITGIGDYSGTLTANFEIVANTNVFEIAEIETGVLGSDSASPKPEVKYAGKVLVEGVDYEVSYINNDKAGTATVVITGKGAYAGLTGTQNYTINNTTVSSVDENGNCSYLAIVTNKNGFGGGWRIVAEHVDTELKKIPSNAKLVPASTADLTVDELAQLVKGRKTLLNLDIKLMSGNVEITEYEGVFTVKLLVPSELAGAENIQVARLNADGEYVIYETTVEDGYIIFSTEEFDEFMFLGKASGHCCCWWILILCCIICGTTIVICIVIRKKKKEDDEDENADKKANGANGNDKNGKNAESKENANTNKNA